MSKHSSRPPGRRSSLEGRSSGDSLSEFVPSLEESALIASEEEAAKRRPAQSKVAAARAVMLEAAPEPVQPKSAWANAAAEKPIDKAALPSANGPAMEGAGAVAPVTAPIKAPEGPRKGWRGLPPWSLPVAMAVVVLGPLVMWLVVRDLPRRQPLEVPAVATSVQAPVPAPVVADGGAPPSVQTAAPAPVPVPAPSETATTSATLTGTAARPERVRVAPKASSPPEDPYDHGAPVKPLPAVTPPPAVTAVPTATPVAPPPVAPAPSTPAPTKSATPPPGPTPMFDPQFDTQKEHGS
jgi:hypothetical protein